MLIGHILLTAILLFAVARELFSNKIENYIFLSLLVSYLLFALVGGISFAEIGYNFLSALLILVAGFFFHSNGWIGAGAVKMIVGVIPWVGYANSLSFILLMVIIGAIITSIMMLVNKIRNHSTDRVPYSPAITLATLIIVFTKMPNIFVVL